jgi:hypothetical protein
MRRLGLSFALGMAVILLILPSAAPPRRGEHHLSGAAGASEGSAIGFLPSRSKS